MDRVRRVDLVRGPLAAPAAANRKEMFAKLFLQCQLEAMENNGVKRVTDAATPKAVAHPLRSKLLGSLRLDGPATASELARRFGESSGSTSYHLRVLAAFDFIEEDPDQPNARDRRWRAMHRFTSWNERDFEHDPAGAEAVAFGHDDLRHRLTAVSLKDLRGRFAELIDEYAARDGDAEDAQDVVVFLSAHGRRSTSEWTPKRSSPPYDADSPSSRP